MREKEAIYTVVLKQIVWLQHVFTITLASLILGQELGIRRLQGVCITYNTFLQQLS